MYYILVLFPDENTTSLCCWDSRNADRQRLLGLGNYDTLEFKYQILQTKSYNIIKCKINVIFLQVTMALFVPWPTLQQGLPL